MIKSRPLIKILSIVVVSGIFYFMGRYIWRNWAEINSFDWNVDYIRLLLSLCLLCLAFIMMAFGWYIILRILNVFPHPLLCFRIYTTTQLARYVPGKIFGFIGRVVMAERIGVAKSISALSVLFEAIVSTAGAFFAILLVYPFSDAIQIEVLSPFRIGLVLAGGLGMLNPWLIRFVLNKIYVMRYGSTISIPFIEFRYYQFLLLILYYILTWIMVGTAFYLLVDSFLSSMITSRDGFNIICIFLVSWLVGFLSFLAPGGIGVREAIITVGLGKILPLYLVSVLAIFSRLWFTIAELLVVVIAYLIPHRVININVEKRLEIVPVTKIKRH